MSDWWLVAVIPVLCGLGYLFSPRAFCTRCGCIIDDDSNPYLQSRHEGHPFKWIESPWRAWRNRSR